MTKKITITLEETLTDELALIVLETGKKKHKWFEKHCKIILM